MFTEQLIVALSTALKAVTDEDVKRSVKARIKMELKAYIEENEKNLEEARKYEQQCLQSDDNFSRETEAAMAEVEYLSVVVEKSKELLSLLPEDIVVERITTGGVRYDVF